ncbi:GNAT family N-acetyltransferase [Maritalea porphyrae]|jgi:GNAT superfamily N-acetyltransferase|uniref:GNAT family N-acetyltransferase n=1 Tax=Maritalea porphyrae TaxID=880732 RepID=UPI0022AFF536|nr:GNAT family N-acetyltransferase [Maritalea porphyrae]MCZ4270969.1 GNAT family N-acetyltransferase [Maritalea porphyrae]
MTKVQVRALEQADRAAWGELYGAYARFYNSPQTEEMRDKVWSWLHADANSLFGLVAIDKNADLVGLAHCREFARPLAASTGLFLDDLYVDPDSRGTGAAEALIAHIRQFAVDNQNSIVRWVTADNNYRARGLYDHVARKTDWLTYDIQL